MSLSAEYDDLPPRHFPRSTPDGAGCTMPISASTPSIASAASSKAASPAPPALFLTDTDGRPVSRQLAERNAAASPSEVHLDGGAEGVGTVASRSVTSESEIVANVRVLVAEGMDPDAAENALTITKNDLQMARQILRFFVPKQHSQLQQQQPPRPASPQQQQQMNAQRAQEHYRN